MVATEKSHFVAFKLKKVVPKPQKNTICGSPNHQKKRFCGVIQWGQWKTTAKIHFDHYLRGFWGGYCTHLIFI
jgi:hypothetical protein